MQDFLNIVDQNGQPIPGKELQAEAKAKFQEALDKFHVEMQQWLDQNRKAFFEGSARPPFKFDLKTREWYWAA